VPDLTKRLPDDEPPYSVNEGVEVGAPTDGFGRQGTTFSQWALARYLVGRALGVSVSNNLLVVALLLFGLAAVLQWVVGTTFWAIVVAVVGLVVLGMRALIRWALNKLTAADMYGPLEDRLRALVSETRGDILAELRRVGLPGHTWSIPLLAINLVRPKRRGKTLERLKQFDVDRAVTPARVDELHHIMRAALNRPGRFA
jgi:hypothetical protein